jgi:hypothetical protein
MRDGDTAADWFSEQRFAGGKSTRVPGWDIAIFNQAVYFQQIYGINRNEWIFTTGRCLFAGKAQSRTGIYRKIRRALGRLGVANRQGLQKTSTGEPWDGLASLGTTRALIVIGTFPICLQGPGHHNAV